MFGLDGNPKSTPGHLDEPNARVTKGVFMTSIVTIHQPILALIAGVIILIFPRILNFVVAIYLIIIGILGLTRM